MLEFTTHGPPIIARLGRADNLRDWPRLSGEAGGETAGEEGGENKPENEEGEGSFDFIPALRVNVNDEVGAWFGEIYRRPTRGFGLLLVLL